MPLTALGISHHTAPIEIRERVAVSTGDSAQKLASLASQAGIDEALILSTCNRTELYCTGPELESGQLSDWVHSAWGLGDDRIDDHLYFRHGTEAVRHLIRVAGGMDSLVLGESQILGQLKQAWQEARQAGTAGTMIDRLCQHAVTTAKSIRRDSPWRALIPSAGSEPVTGRPKMGTGRRKNSSGDASANTGSDRPSTLPG